MVGTCFDFVGEMELEMVDTVLALEAGHTDRDLHIRHSLADCCMVILY